MCQIPDQRLQVLEGKADVLLLEKLLERPEEMVFWVRYEHMTSVNREQNVKLYKLLGADRKIYLSPLPGTLGGNRNLKIYGRLDCWSANAAIPKGYATKRVFFADEKTAIQSGYRPCGNCMKEQYKKWKAGGVPGSPEYPWLITPKGDKK